VEDVISNLGGVAARGLKVPVVADNGIANGIEVAPVVSGVLGNLGGVLN
jgi:hypothetical protein